MCVTKCMPASTELGVYTSRCVECLRGEEVSEYWAKTKGATPPDFSPLWVLEFALLNPVSTCAVLSDLR